MEKSCLKGVVHRLIREPVELSTSFHKYGNAPSVSMRLACKAQRRVIVVTMARSCNAADRDAAEGECCCIYGVRYLGDRSETSGISRPFFRSFEANVHSPEQFEDALEEIKNAHPAALCLNAVSHHLLMATRIYRVRYTYELQNLIDRWKRSYDLIEKEADYLETVTVTFACPTLHQAPFLKELNNAGHRPEAVEDLGASHEIERGTDR